MKTMLKRTNCSQWCLALLFEKLGHGIPMGKDDARQRRVPHALGTPKGGTLLCRGFPSWIAWTIAYSATRVPQDQEVTVASPVSGEERHSFHLQINQKRVNDEKCVFGFYCPQS